MNISGSCRGPPPVLLPEYLVCRVSFPLVNASEFLAIVGPSGLDSLSASSTFLEMGCF